MITLLAEAITKLKIMVSTFQKQEAIVTLNQSHDDLATYLLRFLDPIVHTCSRQLATQQSVVETFKNLTNEKESAFSIVHKENVDFFASLPKLQEEAL